MDSQQKLTELFKKFPGIGSRQASRFVYYLLRKGPSFSRDLANQLTELHKNIRQCQESFQYFFDTSQSQSLSPICRDASRDRSQLMIVEKDVDLEAVERSGSYTGLYFVTGGLAPIIKEDVDDFIRTRDLLRIVKKRAAEDGLQEIIMGLAFNPEGENTRMYFEQRLQEIAEEFGIKISRLGRGLSTGTELEYSDADTLKNALDARV